MEFSISTIFQLLFIISAFLFVIGLIRPGFVIFWTERKSRTSVIAVWGAAMLLLGLAYFFTLDHKNDPNKVGVVNQIKTVWRG